ncbi:MAG: ABC transporter ATP-binding protein [Anaerolineales bacterium]|nr:ABC transporter ATP-binding protein [Anaerolineales bacterium]MCB9128957.1 ABC transporter ATP-binding protein [Ardenticatenales bacterium]MCB9172810.1 ABC transporter ATP-binding protein [Ardenticatenales bacterium]
MTTPSLNGRGATSEFVVSHPWESDRRGPVRWIISHLRRQKIPILMVLIGAYGNGALAAMLSVYSGQAFDAINRATPDIRGLVMACVWLVISQLVRSVLQLGRNFGSELLGQRLERDARDELYGVLLGKSMQFHDSYPSGEMMARATNDVHELALMITPGLNLVIGSGMFLIQPLLFAPAYHPALLLTPIWFTVAYALVLRRYLGQLNVVTSEVRESFGRMNSVLTQAIEGIATVKGAVQEPREIGRFERFTAAVRNAFVAQGELEARFLPLLLLGIAQATALLHSVALYRSGSITLGAVVAYQGLMSLYGFPVFTSLLAYSQLSSGVSSARRVLALMEDERAVDRNVGGYAEAMRGRVEFDDVTFSYETEAPDGVQSSGAALGDLSFALAAGQTLAVVGQTGAGKSTIAKLLNRTYDVEAGAIRVDGVDVRDWQLAALRRQISIIEQDIFLFSRSVADNIRFGRPDATLAQVEAAARAAQAHDFIMAMPDGYQTQIGERGVRLSGGQRQRLALARAFLTEPAILVLDDSTSAIDSATEDRIQQAIEAASAGRTTILITHRLSQIRRADRILVLRQGQIVGCGTHDGLLASSPAYRNIFARG